jgi:hypothetical protein
MKINIYLNIYINMFSKTEDIIVACISLLVSFIIWICVNSESHHNHLRG